MFIPTLKKGDRIGLICPSSPIPPSDIDLCRSSLEELGYEVILGGSLRLNRGGFMAGSPEERARDLHRFFSDKTIGGVFCARGGDSSLELLQHLDRKVFLENPKVFLGYSDITNLHVFLNQECNLVTFHGPMVQSDIIKGLDSYSLASLERNLEGGDYDYENPPGDPLLVLVPGQARGRLVGGNLSLISAGLGGPYEVDTKGKILFLEDVNESVEHLHRMLWQLFYAGKFQELAGVILGDFNNCNNRHDPSYGQDQLFRNFFSDFKVPVLAHLRSGHCMPMATLPLGAKTEIDDDKISFSLSL